MMKRLKLAVLVLIFLLPGNSLFSQEDSCRFSQSISIGSNIYNFKGSNNEWKFYHIPFFVGYNINYQLNKNFSLSSGLMIENVYSKGWLNGNDTVLFDPEMGYILERKRINCFGVLPIMFNYEINKIKLRLSTGFLINLFNYYYIKDKYELGLKENYNFRFYPFNVQEDFNFGLTTKINWLGMFNRESLKIGLFIGANWTSYYPSKYGQYIFYGINVFL